MITHYSLSTAVAVLDASLQLLLIHHHVRGWELPGGCVDPSESVLDAAVREVREETGILVELTQFCGVSQNIEDLVLCCLFRARPVFGNPKPLDECDSAGYFSLDEAISKVDHLNLRDRIRLCMGFEEEPVLMWSEHCMPNNRINRMRDPLRE